MRIDRELLDGRELCLQTGDCAKQGPNPDNMCPVKVQGVIAVNPLTRKAVRLGPSSICDRNWAGPGLGKCVLDKLNLSPDNVVRKTPDSK